MISFKKEEYGGLCILKKKKRRVRRMMYIVPALRQQPLSRSYPIYTISE